MKDDSGVVFRLAQTVLLLCQHQGTPDQFFVLNFYSIQRSWWILRGRTMRTSNIEQQQQQELTNTAWAFATANHRDEKLLAALARWGYQRVGDFNLQDFQIALWAFSQREHVVVSWSSFPCETFEHLLLCASL